MLSLDEQQVNNLIFEIRGFKVMLDQDLADLYDVPTKRLNEQVKRNKERFPPDFMFELSNEECESLRSQIATSSWGGRRYNPFVFTEHGVLMLSSVLRSKKAIAVNIQIMRVFIKMREMMISHQEIFKKLEKLEAGVDKNSKSVQEIFKYMRALARPPRNPIGY